MSFSGNKLLFICGLLLSTFFCKAQHNPLYDQYRYNGLAINPAFAGSREVMNVAVLYRMQWLKMESAPVTQTLAGDFPLYNPQLALGLLVVNDKTGVYGKTGIYGIYAFRIKTRKGKFSLGLQGGFDRMREDLTEIKTLQSGDPMFDAGQHRLFMPNIGIGSYYYSKTCFAGLSIPRLLLYVPVGADKYKGKLSLHDVMLYGGVNITVHPSFKIKPSTLIRYSPHDIMIDVNCNAVFLPGERLEAGLSYRSTKVWGVTAGIRINPRIHIGYAYDHAFGIANIAGGSHEMLLRYEFRYRINAQNPLYLK
ncbi:MAG: type IX secretion system membrane protein PorP/SprF [Bacteroidales bacterium]|jgi:type IX secretion system PorP/SprF family membrane protein|nr:type IX secretion system membrane protein PorP/SprF [Bacteroidales bacterium]